jgi:hypothetical protein
MEKQQRMTQSEYARYRRRLGLPGGSPAAVSQAVLTGRITKEADGSIDPRRADKQWLENTNEWCYGESHPQRRPLSEQLEGLAMRLVRKLEEVDTERRGWRAKAAALRAELRQARAELAALRRGKAAGAEPPAGKPAASPEHS